MSETDQNYAIGYGKPPVGRRFQKGQSGNPGGPRGRPGKNNLSALLLAALDEPVYVTIDGHRRKITKREAIVTQMVDKSAAADLRHGIARACQTDRTRPRGRRPLRGPPAPPDRCRGRGRC